MVPPGLSWHAHAVPLRIMILGACEHCERFIEAATLGREGLPGQADMPLSRLHGVVARFLQLLG